MSAHPARWHSTSAAHPRTPGRPNFTPALQIYDHNLSLLAKKTGSADGQGARAVAGVPAPGRYYLRVANDGGARSPGNYSVAVTMSQSR
jgi:hypothetical protein